MPLANSQTIIIDTDDATLPRVLRGPAEPTVCEILMYTPQTTHTAHCERGKISSVQRIPLKPRKPQLINTQNMMSTSILFQDDQSASFYPTQKHVFMALNTRSTHFDVRHQTTRCVRQTKEVVKGRQTESRSERDEDAPHELLGWMKTQLVFGEERFGCVDIC